MRESLNNWKWNILSLSLFLLIWEIGALSLNNNFLFPSIFSVADSLMTILTSTTLYFHLLSTFFRSLECLFISFVIALPLSYLINKSEIAEKLLSPFLYFMKNTPVIAFLLLALIWISAEYVPTFIAFIGMLPILVINFVAGFRSIDKRYIELASLYELSPLRKFLFIEYPAVKSYLFAGLSSALGLGWRAIIIGEALASVQYGLGAAMKEAQNYVDVPFLFSVMIISLFVSFLIEKLVQFLSNLNPHKFIKNKHRVRISESQGKSKALYIDSLSFKRGSSSLYDSFSLQIEKGEVLLVKGRSGVGKSTLIDIIGGFEKNFSGSVSSAHKSVLFQDLRLCPWLSVGENIDLILPEYISEDERYEMCKIMGIAHLMTRMPDQISGGEAQRVALCRALLYPAELYILDEPLTGIGDEQKKELLKWIRSYVNQKRVSVLWISHDEDHADIADRILQI